MPHAHASGFPPRSLECADHGEGQALALRYRTPFFLPHRFRSYGPEETGDTFFKAGVIFIVARGPVPRDRWSARTISRPGGLSYGEIASRPGGLSYRHRGGLSPRR